MLFLEHPFFTRSPEKISWTKIIIPRAVDCFVIQTCVVNHTAAVTSVSLWAPSSSSLFCVCNPSLVVCLNIIEVSSGNLLNLKKNTFFRTTLQKALLVRIISYWTREIGHTSRVYLRELRFVASWLVVPCATLAYHHCVPSALQKVWQLHTHWKRGARLSPSGHRRCKTEFTIWKRSCSQT